MDFKKALFKGRVIILLIALILSIVAINPHPFNEGASIRFVEINSSASLAGIQNPKPTAPPLAREIILSVDNIKIKGEKEYYDVVSNLALNESIQLKTNKGLYKLTTKEKDGFVDLGLTVADAPTSNLRKGLDLQGGTRILLQPQEELSPEDLDLLILNMNERFNVFGLSDVSIRSSKDLEGATYILIEVSGGNDQEIKDLIGKQGKFEAKIGNVSVFRGGDDITYVCRSSDCSGLSPYAPSQQLVADQWSSTFQFSISLNNDAAKRMSEATKQLTLVGQYLSQPISLYLDDQLVDELQIGASLRGQIVNDIAISGPGLGRTQQESQLIALQNMKRLQTILITGSLPVKLDVVKADSISPTLGDSFLKDTVVMMLLAIAAVTAVIFVRYRKLSVVIPIFVTSISEVILTLGTAALFGWNIDIAAIAGILVAVGTGVDDQIVIMDELTSKKTQETSWLKRMKNAFFIIFAAYLTALASMVPLLFAGAGLLKGFAITSIIGITVGVLITRPAFGSFVEELFKDNKDL